MHVCVCIHNVYLDIYVCMNLTLLSHEVLGHVAQELVARRDERHLSEEVPWEQQFQHCVAHLTERIFVEFMTSDRKLKASRQGSK